jgi:hypothetical protein
MRVLMERDVEDRGIAVKGTLRAISMMDIPINDGNPV